MYWYSHIGEHQIIHFDDCPGNIYIYIYIYIYIVTVGIGLIELNNIESIIITLSDELLGQHY